MSAALDNYLFTRTAERGDFLAGAERFLAQHYPPTQQCESLRRPALYDAKIWQAMAELGWLSVDLAEERGGLDLDFSWLIELIQTLGPGLICEPLISQTSVAGFLLGEARRSEPLVKILESYVLGQAVVSFGHHEHADDSYFRAPIQATFKQSSNHLVLSGQKASCVDGAAATAFLISARNAEAPEDIRLFLVDAADQSLQITKQRYFDGRNGADIAFEGLICDSSLAFDQPLSNLVDMALSRYVLAISAESLGIMQAALKLTRDYLNEREQFGVKIGTFQALQHRLVDMFLAITRVESLVVLAKQQISALGLEAAAHTIAAAKVQADDAATLIAAETVQLHGAIGMTDEFIVAHYVKRLTANRLIAGSRGEHLMRFVANSTAET